MVNLGGATENDRKKIVVVNGTKKPWRNEEGFVIKMCIRDRV